MQRIYLAGFDVFRADSISHGERLKALCREHGYEGLYPLDNQAPAHLAGQALADWIYRQNVTLIRRADLVMANLNRFRGAEPDSGTAFEVGYAVALGKPVWAYTDETHPLVQQVPGQRAADGRWVDAQGYTVEDFGLPLNLMLACGARYVQGDARACLRRIAAA
ncbi:nucleoside 2-deoxyribosyltransferase [Bordetella avium]|uniref:Nucleoside 2-deoxyribosyltransferase n=1 Tax=Bordetella avium (strain 197N) TaxID=360910 RepID=Q2KTK9_BORA1|nr:nucleoside 2-deoxyribosyltransferase [Bordetella avium]AZY50708.1 nucleoside 2-deoxyribosyltransferase [Bordetella avium]AZY54106.1 nucleoside 2-deoxyribosyltransferase [Bordetella avium]RIQ15123.1 nucleoside 2-deoxyribosyltransferase [Bordetella avium]RIQ20080.1 nucleoside 2-deoxyribosyltransferase [Bordetella avium]RIQ34660.1 nucleoside 2-deoxyribosyltransferase [Bordetella avium]